MFRHKLASVAALFLLFFSTAYAGDNIEFNFQGRIFSGGQPINGTAQVKFALIDTSGTTSVWSNDETSVAAGEPVAAIPVSVDSGVFDVMIGDTGIGMEPIHGAIFNGRDDLRMRIWLSDGVNGFEQLTPDRRIPNADLLGLRTLTAPLIVYVDALNGNDLQSGLAPNMAKASIQAAVKMIPRYLEANAVVRVGAGVYRESVDINNVTSKEGANFSLIGDEYSGTPETSIPAVRITGTDNDLTHEVVRDYGISVKKSSNVIIDGFLIDHTLVSRVEDSNISLNRLRFEGATLSIARSVCIYSNTWIYGAGMNVQFNSYVFYESGGSIDGYRGVFVNSNSDVLFQGTSKFLNNSRSALEATGNSVIRFDGGVHEGIVQNNARGLYLDEGSVSRNYTATNTLSGNGVNLVTATGGASFNGSSPICVGS